MTTVLYKVERASAVSTCRPSVAPGPSGSTYFAEGSSGATANIARINSDGTVNWQKEITIPGYDSGVGITPNIAASSDHVAVVLRHAVSSVYTTIVVLYDSSGTLIWQKTVPLEITAPNILGGTPYDAGVGGLVLAEDESVYLTGTTASNVNTLLVKLAGADGSLSWHVNLNPSSGGLTDDNSGPLALLSGGDVIAVILGADSSGERTHVQRISATDGSIVWTRRIDWANFSLSGGAMAIDTSDNIYVAGPPYEYVTNDDLPIIKLDSSGTLAWSRNVTGTPGYFGLSPRLTADTSGVWLAVERVSASRQTGHVFVLAAGTVASSNVPASFYPPTYTTAVFEVHGSGAAGANALMTFTDKTGTPYYSVIVKSTATTTGEDQAYGAYTRASTNYNLAAGSASISTVSYTRASTPSFSVSSATIGEATATLTVTALTGAIMATATGIPSALSFGSAYMNGVELPFTASTAFGTPRSGRSFAATGASASTAFGTPVARPSYSATGLAAATAFGTPAYQPHSWRTATGIASTTAFGDVWSIRGVGPPPIGHATGIAPTTTFGTPSETDVTPATASGFATTAFGTAVARYGLAATGLAAATAFGTAKVQNVGEATGVASTAFGTPRVSLAGLPVGLAASTAFGTPRAVNRWTCTATGWTATAFGTPMTAGNHMRTRSGVFRTRFGTPQAERTAP